MTAPTRQQVVQQQEDAGTLTLEVRCSRIHLAARLKITCCGQLARKPAGESLFTENAWTKQRQFEKYIFRHWRCAEVFPCIRTWQEPIVEKARVGDDGSRMLRATIPQA